MRQIGTLHPTDNIPVPADSVSTIIMASSSGQSMDYPSGASLARFSGMTTAGATMNFFLNAGSTAATIPSSGSSGSTAAPWPNIPVMGQGSFQIPGGATGFSVAGLSSGYVVAEFWKK